MLKKLFAVLFVLILCISGGYFYLKLTPNIQSQKLLGMARRKDFHTVEDRLTSSRLPHPSSLYKGYLAQMERHFVKANYCFHQTLPTLEKNGEKKTLVETYLALATNAYFEGRHDELTAYIKKAHSCSSHHFAFPFYDALQAYLHGDYKMAGESWEKFSPPDELRKQSWFLAALDTLFPPSWTELHMAHALIETGEFIKGRHVLESETRFLEDENRELYQLAVHLLGLTYILEAKEIPLNQRESHYKIARYYFETTPFSNEYLIEHSWVTRYIKEAVEGILFADTGEECKKWGLAFLHILQKWKADAELESLADQICAKILNEQDLHLCQLIHNEFLGTSFHILVTEKVLSAFATAIQTREEDPFASWNLVHALTPFADECGRELAFATLDNVFKTLQNDEKAFKQLPKYLTFWEHFSPPKNEREILAQELVFQAKQFWFREGEEKKGEYLMSLAFHLSNHVMQEIENFLVELYDQAQNSNLINRMALIYDSLDHFHIYRQELISKSILANHLADAQYLYESRRFNCAKTIAFWLLKIEPANTAALRLAGLSLFHLGDYTNALVFLKELADLDPLAEKALLLSQAFASQAQEKHLAQIDMQHETP